MKARWAPKEKHRADPSEVLREAIRDGAEGCHKLALLKHLWFHGNSTRIQPSLSGVRRSYALQAWRDLSQKYEPARAALLRTRNGAARMVWKKRDPWEAFHDFASINEYLNEEKRTAALFVELDRRSRKKAKCVYNLVEPILFREGNYKLCARYLEPDVRFSSIRRSYRVNLRIAKDPTVGSNLVQFAERSFAEKATRLIALLALNGRRDEVKRIARMARRVWRNDEFHSKVMLAEIGEI